MLFIRFVSLNDQDKAMLLMNENNVTRLSQFALLPRKFEALYKEQLYDKFLSGSEVFNMIWEQRSWQDKVSRKFFEELITEILTLSGLSPVLKNVVFTFLPNIVFSVVVYTEEIGPIVFYIEDRITPECKYLDFQSYFLRQTIRKSRSYLITLDSVRAKEWNKKISAGNLIGLDRVVNARSKDFDHLLFSLRELTYVTSVKVDLIKSYDSIFEMP